MSVCHHYVNWSDYHLVNFSDCQPVMVCHFDNLSVCQFLWIKVKHAQLGFRLGCSISETKALLWMTARLAACLAVLRILFTLQRPECKTCLKHSINLFYLFTFGCASNPRCCSCLSVCMYVCLSVNSPHKWHGSVFAFGSGLV